jgi:hypothetical protein
MLLQIRGEFHELVGRGGIAPVGEPSQLVHVAALSDLTVATPATPARTLAGSRRNGS